jgi:hypothetical protein
MALDQKQELHAAKRAGIEFLLADIESAHAFLDVADSNASAESVQRNLAHARRALASVQYFLQHLEGDADLLNEVQAARDKLQKRVDGFGDAPSL